MPERASRRAVFSARSPSWSVRDDSETTAYQAAVSRTERRKMSVSCRTSVLCCLGSGTGLSWRARRIFWRLGYLTGSAGCWFNGSQIYSLWNWVKEQAESTKTWCQAAAASASTTLQPIIHIDRPVLIPLLFDPITSQPSRFVPSYHVHLCSSFYCCKLQ
jgi:hypothetical protein